MADRIYVSFRNTKAGITSTKIRFTGNPIRKDLLASVERKKDSAEGSEKKFTVLILGGSQGAHSINMTILDALGCLKKPEKYFFIHQTGVQDEKIVRETYMRYGIDSTVQAFFDDMGSVYQMADLVICRAGASTVAEISAVGKCAIFIPYPYAADDHQALNAQSIIDAGAGEIIYENTLSGKLLAERVASFVSNPLKLKEMAEKSKALGSPHSADDIIEDCYGILMKKDAKKKGE